MTETPSDPTTATDRARQLDALHRANAMCRKCVEHGSLAKANPIFSGHAHARVMLVGQAPGIKNEENTFPFNGGRSGQRLFEWLSEAGWTEDEFRERHYITSVTRCYPGKNRAGTGDRVPTPKECTLCAEWLEKELAIIDVACIIAMGKLSIERFLGRGTRLDEVVGRSHNIDGRIVVPIPHPSGASTWYLTENNKRLLGAALRQLNAIRERHSF